MIDLHTHTTCSDGTDSPRALINAALSKGISVLGITDHDSTAGWDEASKSLRPGLSLVLGAEVSCLTQSGTSVHMLGLLFDREDSELATMLEESRDSRIPRMRKMVGLLSAAGMEITMEDVYAATPPGATLGRPHLADALVARGILKSRDEAFQGLLNNNSEFYVQHMAPTPEEAIAKIRAAGGVAVIAHAYASMRGQLLKESDLELLVKAGLNGIEVDHRDHSGVERTNLRKIAGEFGLVVTGSSDYHGTGKMNSLGENTTDAQEWDRLEAIASERRVVKA
ncbi:MAG: PHP domain-containing protein [Actinobacteria bacterium]|nr:PHP domain-containing protein [Actinomycetota bacterium]